jgi:hypothetical protein
MISVEKDCCVKSDAVDLFPPVVARRMTTMQLRVMKNLLKGIYEGNEEFVELGGEATMKNSSCCSEIL